MGNVSVNLPSDGETADVADYNTPINTIVNEMNGNLDNSNIASDAAIAGSKLADDSVTAAKMAAKSVVGASMGTPVAFSAYLNSSQNNPTNGDTVTLNAEDFDLGSNFNTSTYKFVAPYAGVYAFDGAIGTAADDARLRCALAVNGTAVATGAESTKRAATVSKHLSLAASDEVTLEVYVGTGTTDLVTGSVNTWMSGHLVGRTD